MTYAFFKTRKETAGYINRDPYIFISDIAKQVQKLDSVQDFKLEVRINPYKNAVIRFFDRLLNYLHLDYYFEYFRPKVKPLTNLDDVKKHHDDGFKLRFDHRVPVLSAITLPESAIAVRFKRNDSSYEIGVFGDKVEINASSSNEETESVVEDLSSALRNGLFRELYLE